MNARLPITGRAAELAAKDPKLGLQLRLMASDFGSFCRYFATRSPETGEIFTLDEPFDGQRCAIEAMQSEPKVYRKDRRAARHRAQGERRATARSHFCQLRILSLAVSTIRRTMREL